MIALYEKRINEFINYLQSFCNNHKIPFKLYNALLYKSFNSVGPFWQYLYSAPKLYLANSMTFLNYRRTLDDDFKNELLTDSEIFYFQTLAQEDKDINILLRKKLDYDYIG